MNRMLRLTGITLLAGILGAPAFAQVITPKPPDKYDVQFRYRIKADRNERIRQFLEMEKFLGKLGFKEKENDDADLAMFDPSAERMIGTIPGDNGRSLLGDPRIQTVLLAPAGFKPPDDENERVKVVIDLFKGFTPERQQLFSRQVKQILGEFGFVEAAAYDHRGYSRLRGAMPWLRVPTLLKDLRGQPSGWFLPLTPEEDLPDPYKTVLPVRLVEVLSEEGAPAAVPGQAALPPVEDPQLAKLSADVRRRLLEPGKKDEPLRVEVALNYTPPETDNDWRERFKLGVPTAAIEGRLGNIVTLTVPAAEQVGQVARLPMVMAIRLPRSASTVPPPAPKEQPEKDDKENAASTNLILAQAVGELNVLKETRLDRLHALGKRGGGVRIAVIDTDFTGFEKQLGKGLPKTTHYVDLTAERNSEIVPEPTATKEGIGHGTHCALAVAYAAPETELVLVRVASDAPYQIVTAYRIMLGDIIQPESFRVRREELDLDAAAVRVERTRANEQYRKAFDNFEDDEATRQARRAAKAAIAEAEKKEIAITQRANRLLKLESDLARIKGANVILNTVGWSSGQPLDGTSTISRFLDEKMSVSHPNFLQDASKRPKPTVWFQPAGDTRGQAWIGQFRDADGNGIMEWAPASAAPRKERWTPELNFLAFRGNDAKDAPELPSEARVRISIQWREPHDPEVSEVEYRQPIAPLDLMLLRQRDPRGEKLASDELEVMARSEGSAERLVAEREFGIYEQSIELTLPAAGRYALRVDGKQPLGIRPGGALGIRDQDIRWELRPRLFIEVLDGATQAKGRIVFGDFRSEVGGVAVPADARTVVAVGALNAARQPQPFSALGSGTSAELFIKPDVMMFDTVPTLAGPAKGSPLAAALATGIGASLISARAERADFLEMLHIPPGSFFQVPEGWLKR